ncbi:CHRD domain-containing protein [Maliponia aquimaris]|uniref:CHRD domain protein n=1 Tax=Maliponia aquimaris TaxID=1673631 RepID=A0A238JZI6_9RHOB|nr:CHRD domain-containing protein [Maliponia aquimaris]SMX36059.1 CHRD domain protein [Maliponia aquimaris]
MRYLRTLALAGAMVVAASASQAATLRYSALLTGAAEAPPVATTGSGTALVVYDDQLRTLRVMFSFADLSGTLTAAHIHGPTTTPGLGTAGVMTSTPTFPGSPLGVTSGSFDATFDLTLASSYSASFITNFGGGTVAGAELALAKSLADGKAYLNLHSTTFGGGEIRGFLTPAIPLPATLPLLVIGLAGFSLFRRRGA